MPSCLIQLRENSNPLYSIGINTSVNNVLTDRPPITVTAKGGPIALTYSVLPIARGNMATQVVITVIRIGLTLDRPAYMMARDLRYPFFRKMFTKSMRIMPLLTTTPSRIRKPVSVLALNRELPVMVRKKKEPIAARGMEKSNTKGVTN